MPDYWMPFKLPLGTKVSKDGTVTFGKEGGQITLSCKVKRCPKCTGSFTLRIVRLAIFYKDKDVTGKAIPSMGKLLYSGETVSLVGRIQPAGISGSNWQWAVPDITIKDFKTKKIGSEWKEGEPIKYLPSDFQEQSISIHWVDGGSKAVILTATAAGLDLTALVIANITRPTVVVDVVPQGPEIQPEGHPGIFLAFAQMDFRASGLSHAGSLQWVQTGVARTLVLDFAGQPLKDRHGNGLDGCIYPNESGATATDQPSIGFVASTDGSVKRVLEVTMYLLWKASRPGLYVPLKSIKWRYNGLLESTGTTTAPVWSPPVPPPPNPNFSNDAVHEEFGYPEWYNCFKTP